MSQSMWADMLGDAGHAGVLFDDAFDASWSEPSEIAGSVGGLLVFAVVEKKRREGIAAFDGRTRQPVLYS